MLIAPNRPEMDKLLKKGYIVDNGRVLGVVPANSTTEEESKRTVLLVGVNKVNEAFKKCKGIISELALLNALMGAGYPVQALNFKEMEGGRIGHVAYVLLKSSTEPESLTPFKEKTSGETLKWPNTTEYAQICSKCLEWPEHSPKCSRHKSNIHRYATVADVGKRQRISMRS